MPGGQARPAGALGRGQQMRGIVQVMLHSQPGTSDTQERHRERVRDDIAELASDAAAGGMGWVSARSSRPARAGHLLCGARRCLGSQSGPAGREGSGGHRQGGYRGQGSGS